MGIAQICECLIGSHRWHLAHSLTHPDEPAALQIKEPIRALAAWQEAALYALAPQARVGTYRGLQHVQVDVAPAIAGRSHGAA